MIAFPCATMKWIIYFGSFVGILLTQVATGVKLRQQIVAEPPQIHYETSQVIFVGNDRKNAINIGNNITAYSKLLLPLFCNVTGSPRPFIRWKIKAANFSKKLKFHGNTLFVKHNPEHSGEYICKVKNIAGAAKKSSFIKFVEPLKPFIPVSRKKIFAINGENRVYLNIGDDLTTIVGTEIDIHCLPSGLPQPEITWYHNGNTCRVNLDDLNYFYNKAIPANASGEYTCVARNAFGMVNVTSHIEVIEPVYPFINGSDKNAFYFDMTKPLNKVIGGRIETLVGASISLKCPASGFPPPKVKWQKDNIPIATKKRMRISEDRLNLLGTIKSDTGWYSCVAYNGAGSTTEATFIQLIPPIRPRIRKTRHKYGFIVDNLPTPFKENVGIELRILGHRKVTIYCSATGFPKPVVNWLKDNKPLTKEDDVSVDSTGQSLIFNFLRISQSALYTCVASNAAGRDIARTRLAVRLPRRPKLDITLIVLSKYKPSATRNMEKYALTPARMVRGSDILLECVAVQGYPGSTFKWFKDNKPLYVRTKELFNKSRLKLRNLRNSNQGTYKCFATNNVGQYQTTIAVYFEDTSSH